MRHYGSGLTVHKCISHAMKIDDACWLLEIVADLPMSVQNLLDPQLAMHGFQVIQCSRLALQLYTSETSTTAVLVPPMLCCCHLLMVTLPPIILLAGLPRIIAGRANSCPHCGHFRSPFVMSSTILSMKHLTKDPLPPFLYLYRYSWHLAQYTLTVVEGPFLLGWAWAMQDLWKRLGA